MMPAADISIVVPCWGADTVPAGMAARWLATGAVREVIVASAPGGVAATNGVDAPEGLRVLPCARTGRGHQMNEGAKQARGGVLLFHHADTELEEDHLLALDAAMRADPTLGGGAFQRKFDERHPHLRWLEPFETWRCRRFGPLFGDQSLFVRRPVFEAMGGYADVPLMEDVDFSLRLRRQGPVALLTPAIRSSSRKYVAQGSWRTTGRNVMLLTLFAFGCSPARLHRWYYRRGAHETHERARKAE